MVPVCQMRQAGSRGGRTGRTPHGGGRGASGFCIAQEAFGRLRAASPEAGLAGRPFLCLFGEGPVRCLRRRGKRKIFSSAGGRSCGRGGPVHCRKTSGAVDLMPVAG
ncbi:hypothetical protein DESPIG_02532 [Desulfovibrio piger ATCC 29098]|uniref:Uncharacterized protein n=1 Tax=Desulfovibrio piger ATCC 29098 TaxID=411464 RepID=B6WWR3_9BACT|nr:hypothetical protein DESPIG_02532 [Desulfovibrio piger ATCC 29098]